MLPRQWFESAAINVLVKRGLIVAAAVVAGVLLFGSANALGIELDLKPNAPHDEVRLSNVIVATLLVCIAARLIDAGLRRVGADRWWPLVASIVAAPVA
jgi:hypothetical protein